MIAHLVQTGFGSFYDGWAHVLITPEDLLIVIGLGLLAGLGGKAESRTLLLALPPAWLLGGVAGAVVAVPGGPAWPTTVSFSLVGVLVVANAKLPRGLLFALAGAAGALHGYGNGTTLSSSDGPILLFAGVVLAVFTLATLTSAFVASRRADWTRVAVRVAGSWVVAIGILMIGWTLRG